MCPGCGSAIFCTRPTATARRETLVRRDAIVCSEKGVVEGRSRQHRRAAYRQAVSRFRSSLVQAGTADPNWRAGPLHRSRRGGRAEIEGCHGTGAGTGWGRSVARGRVLWRRARPRAARSRGHANQRADDAVHLRGEQRGDGREGVSAGASTGVGARRGGAPCLPLQDCAGACRTPR